MTTSPPTDLVVATFPVGPLLCNCSIVGDRRTGRAVVIDPGWDPDLVLEQVARLGFKVSWLIHTHAHLDHINGTAGVHEALGAPAALHEGDLFLYDDVEGQAAMIAGWGLPVEAFVPPRPERLLAHGDLVGEGLHTLGVLHTPGHTPGSLCFFLEAETPVVFSGDTLFSGSVGRTDLPGGDSFALARSIQDRLYALPPATVVVPGHGPTTTIRHERRANPFVRA